MWQQIGYLDSVCIANSLVQGETCRQHNVTRDVHCSYSVGEAARFTRDMLHRATVWARHLGLEAGGWTAALLHPCGACRWPRRRYTSRVPANTCTNHSIGAHVIAERGAEIWRHSVVLASKVLDFTIACSEKRARAGCLYCH